MSTESINNWKNKNLRQEYNHGYDREEKKKQLKMEKEL